MQLKVLLVNVLLTSVVAAKSTFDDPNYCKNQQLKPPGKKRQEPEHELSARVPMGHTLDKRIMRSRSVCLQCCNQTAALCDVACRALHGGFGQVSPHPPPCL